MVSQESNEQLEQEIKQKIDKLKSTITESLGLSNIKLTELEQELQEFQTELHSSSQSTIADQVVDSDAILRLYKAERALTDVLQQKVVELEKELTETTVSFKSMKSSEDLLNNFKAFFKDELAKIRVSDATTIKEPVIQQQPPTDSPIASSSIENLLTKENKANKEERQRLQTENQNLQKELHYYKEKNENLRKELQFRNQEVQSFKKLLQEQEEEEEEVEESYLNRDSINDEYGYTQEEEFELTKEELNTLKGKYLTLERDNEETIKLIDSYKKELTDLKRILGDKNSEIKELKRISLPSEEMYPEEGEPDSSEKNKLNDQIIELKNSITTLEQDLAEAQKQVNSSESQIRELNNTIKKLEEKEQHLLEEEHLVLSAQANLDSIRFLTEQIKKIEKTINVFETSITVDAETFNRHIEVYGLLLGKIFNARGYALVIDTLLKHKGKALTKKMVMNESKTEPHTAIRVLRELHDSKIIHLDEELDQIIWRQD